MHCNITTVKCTNMMTNRNKQRYMHEIMRILSPHYNGIQTQVSNYLKQITKQKKFIAVEKVNVNKCIEYHIETL